MNDMGEALRILRIALDLTNVQMAKRVKVSKSYMSELEKGKKTPSLGTICKYSEGTEIPKHTILELCEKLKELEKEDKLIRYQKGLMFILKKII